MKDIVPLNIMSMPVAATTTFHWYRRSKVERFGTREHPVHIGDYLPRHRVTAAMRSAVLCGVNACFRFPMDPGE